MFQGYGCQDRIHHQRSARLAFFHTILQDRPMLIAWLKNAHERVLQPRVHNSFGLDDGKKEIQTLWDLWISLERPIPLTRSVEPVESWPSSL